jgi:toxin CptA
MWIDAGRRRMTTKEEFSYGCWTAKTIRSGAGAWVCRPPKKRIWMSWSDASATCRLEWRRSNCLLLALCVLAGAAVAALWLSELPQVWCVAVSVLVPAYLGWLLNRELRRADCALSWSGGDASWQIECNGRTEALRHVGAVFRGRLVVLTLADEVGRTRRYLWWSDTLDVRGRRALRLTMLVKQTTTPTQPTLSQ